MEATSQIVSIRPRRGRGPGMVIFSDGNELGTFDGSLIQQAAGAIGQECTYTWKESPSKDGSKSYKNLLTLVIKAPEPEGTAESPINIIDTSVSTNPLVSTDRTEVIATRRLEPLSAMARLEQGFALAVRQRELLEEFIAKNFALDVHYMDGAVFGSKKKVLILDGARLIHVCFGHVVSFEILAGPMEASQPMTPYTIVVKAKVFRGDVAVGEGLGSCTSLVWSSRSARYQDRATSPDLTHNATLKIAKKRAYIDSCFNTTGITTFTQDLDEYPAKDEDHEKGFIKK